MPLLDTSSVGSPSGTLAAQLCQSPGSFFPNPFIRSVSPTGSGIDQGEHKKSILKNVLLYLFFPVAIPVALYKVITEFRERFGLKRRPLEGKVVLITGASSGIGRSLAHLFYTSGCRLILASRRLDALEKVKSELVVLKTYGPVYVPAVVQIDLEDLNTISGKAREILAIYGAVDVLINNAGVSFRGEALETTLDVDQKIMKINYFGPITLTKCITKAMLICGSGQIVFISSIQGKIAIPNRTAYTASKHAVQAFADSIRAELANKNITVTVVSPSYVQTNLSLNALTSNGNTYAQMDKSTETGIKPEVVARRIMKAVMNEEKDVVVSSLFPRLAIFLRYICPSLYFKLMALRAGKE